MRPTSVRGLAAVGLTLWLAFLICALVGLHGLGGAMAPPPMTDPQGLIHWLDVRTAADAAFAVLRLVSLALAWYLLAATVMSTLARLSRLPAFIRTADVFTIPAVRRLANVAAGASFATATISAGAGMADAAGSRWSGPDAAVVSPPTTSIPTTPAPTTAAPTLRRLGEEPSPPAVAPSGALPGPEAPAPPPQAPSTPAPEAVPIPARWEVQPGQHFWAVAEKVLATAWPRPPSEAEIDRYWRHLIDANRPILRDPANPDLLYPGQVLTVPPPPPPAPPPSGPPATEPAAGPGAVAQGR